MYRIGFFHALQGISARAPGAELAIQTTSSIGVGTSRTITQGMPQPISRSWVKTKIGSKQPGISEGQQRLQGHVLRRDHPLAFILPGTPSAAFVLFAPTYPSTGSESRFSTCFSRFQVAT
ncbi:MAG: hypothetical protein Q4A28_02815 [Brachymonas sp.]|nr:hypothetical protein [Brachymonas sp.]